MSYLAFPTPRPPAQARRASAANKSAPPPPYERDTPTDAQDREKNEFSPLSTNYWDEHSREELAGMLSRADSLIRQRERELSFTSEYSRELRNNNQALKQTHQALLARIPGSTPLSSPLSSVQTPHYYASDSLSRQTSTKLGRADVTPANYRHTRRVSVSPSELSRLADQNQDLLQKLQELEEESQIADKAGRRRLGKLEKELSALRKELEEAHARSNALEEHNAALQRTNAESHARQQRDDRPNRSRELDQLTIRADFAPSGSVVMPANFQRRVVSNSSTIRPSTPRSILQELLEEDSTPYKGPSRAPSESSRAPSPSRSEADTREHAIVSQLLAKVRELEEANSQITHNQRETSARLQAAKVEAETIRRVYEYFDENPDIDLELDEGTQASAEPTPTLDNFVFPSPGKNIIRFGSLRRTIDGDVRRMAFENGIRPDRHSTTHAVKPSKRKTIVGLFDSPERSSRSGSSTAFTTLEEIQPIKSLGEGPLSPISSLLSPDDDKVYLPTTGHPTLGSELGSELGDVFNSGGADHFHTSSIYGLESFSVNSSSPPSPRGSIMHRAGEDLRETPMLFPSRPADEPETPQTGTRMRKLSATVRARTSRWVDRRLHDFQSMRMTPETPTPAPAVAETSFESSALVVQPHPALHAIDRVFDAVDAAVERITPLISPARRESPAPDAAALVDSTSVATIVPEERPVTKRRTLSAMMLEAWLWAQFLVIVLVFVYAMAKRGPKSILKDADRKRGRVL